MAAVDGAAAAVEIRRWQQRGFEMLRLVAAVTQNQRWLQGLFGSGRGSSGERRHGHVAGSWLTVCSLVQCLGEREAHSKSATATATATVGDGRGRRWHTTKEGEPVRLHHSHHHLQFHLRLEWVGEARLTVAATATAAVSLLS
ncbi:hypothetical protein OsJ_17489 [Oryza sativa Japonica Group]|uniref:Uncharacterized protein n=1 Tax=Oryza sativa subsp. japonica TaxID=39947 RepID=B9FN07_ORYSJ|nr:hypothetical protein OsJ_17489 [Oryza sativa Japonica Group]